MMTNAAMEILHTRKIKGIDVDSAMVMLYPDENLGTDEYYVSSLCPAFVDKFDIIINVDEME